MTLQQKSFLGVLLIFGGAIPPDQIFRFALVRMDNGLVLLSGIEISSFFNVFLHTRSTNQMETYVPVHVSLHRTIDSRVQTYFVTPCSLVVFDVLFALICPSRPSKVSIWIIKSKHLCSSALPKRKKERIKTRENHDCYSRRARRSYLRGLRL